MPEQFVGPVLAVIGEEAMGREGLLAVAHLLRVLDQIESVEVDARGDAGGGGAARLPARGIDHLIAVPFTGEHRKPLVLRQRRWGSEMILGYGVSSLGRPSRSSARRRRDCRPAARSTRIRG